MFSYQIINTPSGFSLDESRISLIFQAINDTVPVTQKGILNIAFISDEEMQDLNKNYRGKDTTTDVLSFHYFEDFSGISPTDIAGEIILSESRITAQSLEHGHTRQKECEILVLHSVLHIIGYDHETDEDYAEMWKWEEGLREKL